MNIIKNLKQSIRKLPQKGQHNLTKILSLGIGLAVGSILIAKVYFEQHYDAFFPDAKNLYLVYEEVNTDEGFNEYPKTPGAIAHGIKKYAPQVVAATRFTPLSSEETKVETENKNKYSVPGIVLADSCLFDILPRPVIIGSAKDALSRVDYCMIPKSLADAIGGDVIGKRLIFPSLDNGSVTIGAVYEDYPENSQFKDIGVIVSLSSINNYIRDGRENWVGNDRYVSLLKLADNTNPNQLKSYIQQMIKENFPLDDLKKNGVELNFSLKQLSDNYTKSDSVKRMTWILSLIAFILLFSTVMNYLLIVIGQMIKRAKEMAIHKCYGAERKDIYSMIFVESLLSFVLALVVSGLLFVMFKGNIEDVLNSSLSSLLISKGSWILVALLFGILLLISIASGWMYCRIPVATAFRGYNANKRKWKLLLLAIQITAVGFLFSLLVLVWRQYNRMVDDNPGYKYENLAIVNIDGISNEENMKAREEIEKLSSVEQATSSYTLFFSDLSGDNVSLPGEDRQLFNACDLYYVGPKFFSTLQIPIIQGRTFTEGGPNQLNEVMIDRNFAERMKTVAGWDDNVVGRNICITDHIGVYTICGVFDNVRLGSIANIDLRPTAVFYNPLYTSNIIAKFHHIDSEGMKQVNSMLERIFPDKNITVSSYKTEMVNLYQDSRRFRNAVMTGGIVTIVIALIALIGYTNDEVLRRSKEIAVRKVNGAEAKDIIAIFIKDILKIAVPSLIIGGVGAYYISSNWIEQFSEKVSLSPLIFIGCGLIILAIVLITVVINCYKIANSNPVDYIKGE